MGVGVGAGGRAHAGITAAHLTILPAHGTTPAGVYAQSSKALLLRPSANKRESGQSHTHAVTPCGIPSKIAILVCSDALTHVAVQTVMGLEQ